MDNFDIQLQIEEVYDLDHCLNCGEPIGTCYCYDYETSLVSYDDDDDLPF